MRGPLGAENRQSRTISMAENKTKQTDASVDDYIASRANAQQHADCRELWLCSGGSPGLAGLAIRGRELVVYLVPEGQEQGSLTAARCRRCVIQRRSY